MKVALLTREFPPRSTAAPECTSSTSAGSWPGWSRSACLLLRSEPRVRPGRRQLPPLGADPRPPARLRPSDHVGRPAHGGRRRRRRSGAQPHLVRQLRRTSGQAALRHPPCGHHPQPRAAAAMEGRSAGCRLCPRRPSANVPRSGAADAVIAVSESTSATSCSAYPAIPSDRVHVIHNGIDPNEYQPDPRTDVLAVASASTWTGPMSCSSGESPRKRGSSTCSTRPRWLDPRPNSSLCAGTPDTPEFGEQMQDSGR